MAKQVLAIKQVQADFERWRKTRSKRNKIPDHLWQRAVELTKHHVTFHVAKALKLNQNALRAKMATTKSKGPKSSEPVTFIQLNKQNSYATHQGTTTIEFKRIDGTSMVIQTVPAQVTALIESFLGTAQ